MDHPGRYTDAIGGNSEAARLSGVGIRRNVFIVFVVMGLLCGVSGVVMASYVGYGTIAAGQGYELDAIAACILGGTSTLGGVGTISGAMVGSLIMASLTNGLQMKNIAAAWQYVLKGMVLVLAIFMDVYLKRRSWRLDMIHNGKRPWRNPGSFSIFVLVNKSLNITNLHEPNSIGKLIGR